MASIPRMHPPGRHKLLGLQPPELDGSPFQAIWWGTIRSSSPAARARPRHRLSTRRAWRLLLDVVLQTTPAKATRTGPTSSWRAKALPTPLLPAERVERVPGRHRLRQTRSRPTAAGARRLIIESCAAGPWSWHRWPPLRFWASPSPAGEGTCCRWIKPPLFEGDPKPIGAPADLGSW